MGRYRGHLRHRFRSADSRQPQPDRQSPAALVRARHHAVSHRRVQCRRLHAAVREQVDAKNLSRVLYPDDSTPQGKELRLKQQYFFVSASLQDILATHLSEGRTLASMPDAIAIQLNDTHPALAIPELMRLLIDEHGLTWAESWAITTGRVRLHESHACCRRRSRPGRWRSSSGCCRGICRSSTSSTAISLQELAARYPRDRERAAAPVDHHRRRRAARAHGASRGDRQPPRERRCAAAFRAHAHAACSRDLPRCIRSASSTSPTASRCGAG